MIMLMKWTLLTLTATAALPVTEVNPVAMGTAQPLIAEIVRLDFDCWTCEQVSGDTCEHPDIIYHRIPPQSFGPVSRGHDVADRAPSPTVDATTGVGDDRQQDEAGLPLTGGSDIGTGKYRVTAGPEGCHQAWCLIAHEECEGGSEQLYSAIVASARAKNIGQLRASLEARSVIVDFQRSSLAVLGCDGTTKRFEVKLPAEMLRELAQTPGVISTQNSGVS